MPTPRDEFGDELEILGKEVQSGAQFFYTYLSVHALLARDRGSLYTVNRTPLFWKTIDGALHASSFMALGRVFDQKSPHNIDCLIRLAQRHAEIFSKEALAARKRKAAVNADEWLDHFLTSVYVPTASDFRCARKYIFKYRRKYEARYGLIRDKILAHTELAGDADIGDAYGNTSILELEKIFVFLNQFHELAWQLYFNGRKPAWSRMEYSINRILKRRVLKRDAKTAQERVVADSIEFFETILPKANAANRE
jgi:HEPN superfamily AbiU2-like protein